MEYSRRVRKTNPKNNTARDKIYTQYTPEYVDPQFKPASVPNDCPPSVNCTLTNTDEDPSYPSFLISKPTESNSTCEEGVNQLPTSAFSDLSVPSYELNGTSTSFFGGEVDQHYPAGPATQFIYAEEPYPSEADLLAGTESCSTLSSQNFVQNLDTQLQKSHSQDTQLSQGLDYFISDSGESSGNLILSHHTPLVFIRDSESEAKASVDLESVAGGVIKQVKYYSVAYTASDEDGDVSQYLSPPKPNGKLILRHPIVKLNDFSEASYILPYFDRASCLSALKVTIEKDLSNQGLNCRVFEINGLNKIESGGTENADVRIVNEAFLSMDRSESQVCKIDEGFESQVQDDSSIQEPNSVFYTVPDPEKGFILQNELNGVLSPISIPGHGQLGRGEVLNVAVVLDSSGNIISFENVNSVEPVELNDPVSTSVDSTDNEALNELTIPSIGKQWSVLPSSSDSTDPESNENVVTDLNSTVSADSHSQVSAEEVDNTADVALSSPFQPPLQVSVVSYVKEGVVIRGNVNQDTVFNKPIENKLNNFSENDVLENTPVLLGSNHVDPRIVVSSVNNNVPIVPPKTNISQTGDTVCPDFRSTQDNSQPIQQFACSLPILRQQLETKPGQADSKQSNLSVPITVSGAPIVNGTSLLGRPDLGVYVVNLPANSDYDLARSVIATNSSPNQIAVVKSSPTRTPTADAVQIRKLGPSTLAASEVKASDASQSPRARFVEGFVAVCKHCGMTSHDLLSCIRCKRLFPEGQKLFQDKFASSGEKYLTISGTATTVGLGPNNTPIPANPLANANKRTPGGGKKTKSDSTVIRRRTKKTEEIVLLSSDDDEDQPKAKISKQDSDNCANNTETSSCSTPQKKLRSVGSSSVEPLPPGITKHVQVNLKKLCPTISSALLQPSPNRRPQIMLTPGASINCGSDENDKPSFGGSSPEEVIKLLKPYDQETSPKIGDFTVISSSRIRIGDYTWTASPDVTLKIGKVGIYFEIPHALNENQMVDIGIPHSAVLGSVVHFTHRLPCIFIQTGPKYAVWIRTALGLNREPSAGNYYGPVDGAPCQKYIAFQNITGGCDLSYGLFRKIFKSTINELEFTQMNELVCRFKCEEHDGSNKSLTNSINLNSALVITPSTPQAVQNGARSDAELINSTQSGRCTRASTKIEYEEQEHADYSDIDISDNKTILSYQGITINQMDIMCLNPEQFLNDSILDTYMRYLEHEVLSPEDRSRTYMFSTFFYKRLTTTPKKRSQGPSEDDKLSRAEKRHARVSRWTKKVDIFSKDFVFVPINENCHWFLAVICFPGLIGAHSMRTGEPLPEYDKLKTKSEKFRKKYLELHAHGVGGSEDNITSSQSTSNESQTAPESIKTLRISKTTGQVIKDVLEIKQPCIIIFDSLAGDSRSKIFSTLREYLTIEYKTRKGLDREFNKYTIPSIMPLVPQQPNHCDCGIFVLYYVRCFFTHPIKSFCPSIKVEMVHEWKGVRWDGMREEIYNLLVDIALKKNPEVAKFIPKLHFAKLTKSKSSKKDIQEEKVTLQKVKPEDEPMDVDVETNSPVKNYPPETKMSSSSSQSSCEDTLHDVNRTSDHDHDYVSTPDKRMRQT